MRGCVARRRGAPLAERIDRLAKPVRIAPARHLRRLRQVGVTVDTQLTELYWQICNEILAQQDRRGWGSEVIKRLASDLESEF
ncbi:DUF1016 N-terminal domain-containing protein [Nesterenkonia lutea]|uniref:DUF1016 N-terminal domain-containing protein n=1 Tax=Nesterenkonia lutea TaxID=272919 RepID=UPI00298ED743|nr:DUF1016 N-terminal domain-containing protein [Nesterenkonia lutea]